MIVNYSSAHGGISFISSSLVRYIQGSNANLCFQRRLLLEDDMRVNDRNLGGGTTFRSSGDGRCILGSRIGRCDGPTVYLEAVSSKSMANFTSYAIHNF